MRALISVQATDDRAVELDRYFAGVGEVAASTELPDHQATHVMSDPAHAIRVAAANGHTSKGNRPAKATDADVRQNSSEPSSILGLLQLNPKGKTDMTTIVLVLNAAILWSASIFRLPATWRRCARFREQLRADIENAPDLLRDIGIDVPEAQAEAMRSFWEPVKLQRKADHVTAWSISRHSRQTPAKVRLSAPTRPTVCALQNRTQGDCIFIGKEDAFASNKFVTECSTVATADHGQAALGSSQGVLVHYSAARSAVGPTRQHALLMARAIFRSPS